MMRSETHYLGGRITTPLNATLPCHFLIRLSVRNQSCELKFVTKIHSFSRTTLSLEQTSKIQRVFQMQNDETLRHVTTVTR